MPSFRAAIAARCAVYGLSPLDALLFAGVCAFFFFLPLRTDATATIIVMTVFAAAAVKRRRGALRPWPPAGATAPLLAFAAFMVIALVASILNPATLSKFPRVLLWGCCVFSGAALSVCVPEHGSRYFWALFAALVLSFAVAAAVVGYGDPSLWHGDRLKLFAIHPSRLGLYCAICLFFLLCRALVASGRERLLALAGTLFVFFLLFSTNTRGNLLMLPLGLLCLGAALPRRYLKPMAMALFLCAILGGTSLWVKRDSVAGQRFFSAITNPLADSTFESRVPIWHVGWETFKDAPFVGHGHQSFLKLNSAYIEKHKAAMDARFPYYALEVKQVHNLVLGRLVETGVLGTAAFLLFYLGAIAAAWRGPAANRWLLAPLVFYLGMNMFDDGLFRINDALILFVAGTALGGLAARR